MLALLLCLSALADEPPLAIPAERPPPEEAGPLAVPGPSAPKEQAPPARQPPPPPPPLVSLSLGTLNVHLAGLTDGFRLGGGLGLGLAWEDRLGVLGLRARILEYTAGLAEQYDLGATLSLVSVGPIIYTAARKDDSAYFGGLVGLGIRDIPYEVEGGWGAWTGAGLDVEALAGWTFGAGWFHIGFEAALVIPTYVAEWDGNVVPFNTELWTPRAVFRVRMSRAFGPSRIMGPFAPRR